MNADMIAALHTSHMTCVSTIEHHIYDWRYIGLHVHFSLSCPLQNGVTPVMTASFNGHVNVVRALIEAHADINQKMKVMYFIFKCICWVFMTLAACVYCEMTINHPSPVCLFNFSVLTLLPFFLFSSLFSIMLHFHAPPYPSFLSFPPSYPSPFLGPFLFPPSSPPFSYARS